MKRNYYIVRTLILAAIPNYLKAVISLFFDWIRDGHVAGSHQPVAEASMGIQSLRYAGAGDVRWPGHIAPHQTSDAIVANLDIFRTFLEIGGGELPDQPVDGSNVMLFLTGKIDHSPRKRSMGILFMTCRHCGSETGS